MRRDNRGFTLIEILVVVGIIAILALIVVVNVRGNIVNTKTNATKVFIANLRAAIQLYQSDMNTYPPDTLGGVYTVGSDALFEALITGIGGTGKGNAKWKGPYMSYGNHQVGTSTGGQPNFVIPDVTFADGTRPDYGAVKACFLDEFGQPIFYIRPQNYSRVGARLDPITSRIANESQYSNPDSFQLISVGHDGKTKPGELGGMAFDDGIDNDGDGLTDLDDNQKSTLKNGTLAEDDIVG